MGGGFIEGRWVTGLGAPFTVENPSTGAVVTSVTGMSLEQISDAIRAAMRSTRPPGPISRLERVRRLCDAMSQRWRRGRTRSST